MKQTIKLLLIFIIFIPGQFEWANPFVIHYFNEITIDATGLAWKLELFGEDIPVILPPLDLCYLATLKDKAYFRENLLLGQRYKVITNDSLKTPLYINPEGDTITLCSIDGHVFDRLVFGKETFRPLSSGQSLSLWKNYFYYLDNSPTMGAPNDTVNANGIVEGHITDVSENPLADVPVYAEYIGSNKVVGPTATNTDGHFTMRVLATKVGFWLVKAGFQSDYLYVYAQPETTIMAKYTMQYAQSVSQDQGTLYNYKLEGNYPNPFNLSTTITYEIPIDDYVEINVYDLLGRLVQNLYTGFQQAGSPNVRLQANNLATEIYLYSLETANKTLYRKCLLIK